MKIEPLLEMYKIFAPSHSEEEMSKYVRYRLDKMKIEYNTDNLHQIWRINPDTPLLSAHMDQDSSKKLEHVYITLDNKYIFGDGNLGADDKNGVWIILNLLEKYPDTSFIFSTAEEMGCNIDEVLLEEHKVLETIKYCLVFDRMHGKDVIGTWNYYCEDDLDNHVVSLGEKLGYKSTMGIFSDCDMISQVVPCVNISCGFYEPHTKFEYTNWEELKTSLIFGEMLLENLEGRYELCEFNKRWARRGIAYGYGYDGTFEHEYEQYDDEGNYCIYCYTCAQYFPEDDFILEGFCPTCGGDFLDDGMDMGESISETVYEQYYCEACDNTWIEPELDDEYNCPFCGDIVYWMKPEAINAYRRIKGG